MLLAAPDLVLALDVDKILADDARILESLYIIGDVHHSEHVVAVVDKLGETLARPCGQAVVVDEDMVAHAHLGDGDLGTRPDTSTGVLELEPDHLVLLLGKQQLHDVDGVLHPDRVIGVHHREVHEPSVGVHHNMHGELRQQPLGAPLEPRRIPSKNFSWWVCFLQWWDTIKRMKRDKG